MLIKLAYLYFRHYGKLLIKSKYSLIKFWKRNIYFIYWLRRKRKKTNKKAPYSFKDINLAKKEAFSGTKKIINLMSLLTSENEYTNFQRKKTRKFIQKGSLFILKCVSIIVLK